MNISGVLVHVNPEKLDKVNEQLLAIPGVEIHATTDDGRLVVTVEDDDDKIVTDTVMNLHHHEGILSAVMVYQYSNDDENFEENVQI
jgi:nitrate reductase NapD